MGAGGGAIRRDQIATASGSLKKKTYRNVTKVTSEQDPGSVTRDG